MDTQKEIEKEITAYWQKNSIEKKSITINKGKPRFYFLDGPPYATGSIHMGTAWNKIIKDYYIRFLRMSGYNVWVQPGYDTHGLPIENKVEKKLNLKNKDEIEKLGIEKFNSECKKFATEHIGTMNKQFQNLGVWMDWDNPYLTLDNSYIEGAWHTFKVGYKKGFLYKGIYPVHVCSHCATAVAYNEIEYFKTTDPSVYVKFPLIDKPSHFLVIWTTTPWTLPSNTGIMVHPSYEYAYIKTGTETLIIAKKLAKKVMEKAAETAHLYDFSGQRILNQVIAKMENLPNSHIAIDNGNASFDGVGRGVKHRRASPAKDNAIITSPDIPLNNVAVGIKDNQTIGSFTQRGSSSRVWGEVGPMVS